MMRSPFMLDAGWFDPDIKEYRVPNLVAEAARSLGATDDRVRLAIAHAAMREGKKVGRWEVAVDVAVAAGKLPRGRLLRVAQSPAVQARLDATTAEFHAFQVTQRPTFLLENSIGDRAVFSGLARVEPVAAAIDAMLSDAAGHASFAAHFGGPPPG